MQIIDQRFGYTIMDNNTAYTSSLASGNVNTRNVTNTHHNVNGTVDVKEVIAQENTEIMMWLSPLEPRRRHEDVRTNRLDGIGNWLLETTEFREWKSREGGADKAVLFCYGNPGVGKTYLTSLVIDSLRDEPRKEDIAIAMFYCDLDSQREQTTANIIGAILKQLVAREEVLELVKVAFGKAKKESSGQGLRFPDMVQILKKSVAILPRVFICIDGLDECFPEHLFELLGSLKDILQESPRTRIFATGRPLVEDEITKYFPTRAIVPISSNTHDIRRYLERKLDMDIKSDAMSDSLRAEILTIIPQRISEILLPVSLIIDTILGDVTVAERRQKLKEMTNCNCGKTLLGWAARHGQEGVAKLLLEREGIDSNTADTIAGRTPLWSAARGRREVVEGLPLEESDINLDIPNHGGKTALELATPPGHAGVVELFSEPKHTLSVASDTDKVLGKSSPEPADFLQSFSQPIHPSGPSLPKPLPPNTLPPRCIAIRSFMIILFLIFLFRSLGVIIPSPPTGRGDGPGGAGAVTVPLERDDVNPNTGDAKYSQTPLWLAAMCGLEGVVKLLLEREDINPNTASTTTGETPLWLAVMGGHEGVVKLLLEREDINPDTVDTKTGQTPLWLAARDGREGIAKLLLGRGDTNPNTADTIYGQTPLWIAVNNGYEGVIKLLLERVDTNPNTADSLWGQTPLWLAARGGHEGVAKLLLGRGDISPNTADTTYGQTPLWIAVNNGYEGVIKLLLERVDTNPNTADRVWGQTPLWLAARGGHEGVAKLLLGRGDINPNIADTIYGQTPLWIAVENGYEAVIKLLLERVDTNPNTADHVWGKTPLCLAARGGYGGVAKLLLGRGDINPNAADTIYGRTPLWWAADRGDEGVTKLLVERDDVDRDIRDCSGETALELAMSRRYTRLVELLFKPKPSLPVPTDTDVLPERST